MAYVEQMKYDNTYIKTSCGAETVPENTKGVLGVRAAVATNYPVYGSFHFKPQIRFEHRFVVTERDLEHPIASVLNYSLLCRAYSIRSQQVSQCCEGSALDQVLNMI